MLSRDNLKEKIVELYETTKNFTLECFDKAYKKAKKAKEVLLAIFKTIKNIFLFFFVTLSVIVVCLTYYLIYLDTFVWKKDNTSLNNISSKLIDIDKKISKADAGNDYIEINKMKDSFITVEAKFCSSYKLVLRDSKLLYKQPFKSMKYTRDLLDYKKTDSIAWGKLCDSFNNLNQGVPSSILINQFGESEKDIVNTVTVINEVLAQIKEDTDEIHIYVKGYADKEDDFWERKLDSKFPYKEIEYYKANNYLKNVYSINNANLLKAKIPSSKIIDAGNYSNKDLPLLRAKFVFDNYFKDYLKECLKIKSKGGILEGDVVESNSPDIRNTEIYVTVCASEY